MFNIKFRSKGYSNLFVLHKSDLTEALTHYPDAQDILNKKAKTLMRKNASLERARNKPVIVIDNPRSSAETRLLEAVMQAVPPESRANRLLRYGSRGRPRTGAKNTSKAIGGLVKNCTPNILPDDVDTEISIQAEEESKDEDVDTSFQCDVTVHREMT